MTLNVRMSAWDFLKAIHEEKDIPFYTAFAYKLGYTGACSTHYLQYWLKEYTDESYTFAKIQKEIDTGESVEELSEKEKEFVDLFNSKPTNFSTNMIKIRRCKKCQKEYTRSGLDPFLRTIYISDNQKLCPSCFIEDLKKRYLTEKEKLELADTFITLENENGSDGSSYYRAVEIPHYFIHPQKAEIMKKVVEMKKKIKEREQVERKAVYIKEAEKFLTDECIGSDVTTTESILAIVGKLLERIKKAENRTPLSEMRFC